MRTLFGHDERWCKCGRRAVADGLCAFCVKGVTAPPEQPQEEPVRDTLAEARAHVLRNLTPGADCPCCGQLARQYKRTIHAEVGKFFVRLHVLQRDNPEQPWFHIRNILRTRAPKAASDAAYMPHWGLVRKCDDNDIGKKGGLYRLTELGERFALGRVRVARWALIFDNRVMEWSEDTINIHEALRNKFSYEELMRGE